MQSVLRSAGAALCRAARPSLAAGVRTSAAALAAPADRESQPELRPINKDRSNPVPVETSIAYLQSAAYRATYGSEPVWRSYRRNHKGHIPPRKTRRTCVRGGQLSTGNPCPACRDEYLVLDYRNVALLRQFVSDSTGEVLDTARTGLCQVKHRELLAAMARAREFGTLAFDVPFRVYDYDEYKPTAA